MDRDARFFGGFLQRLNRDDALVPAGELRQAAAERELRGGTTMGIFGTPAYDDAVIGRLERTRGLWRCPLSIDGLRPVPLTMPGSGREPDAAALAAARQIPSSFASLKPIIQRALFEHYEPYAGAASDRDASADSVSTPAITAPEQVWAHVSLHSVAIIKLSGVVTAEFVYSAAWDEDHTLGVRFQDGRFVELCGSV